jgi:hypothetical protein
LAHATHPHVPAPKVTSYLVFQVAHEEIAPTFGSQEGHQIKIKVTWFFPSNELLPLKAGLNNLSEPFPQFLFAVPISFVFFKDIDYVSGDSLSYCQPIPSQNAKDIRVFRNILI